MSPCLPKSPSLGRQSPLGSPLQIQRMCNGLSLPGADKVSDYKGIKQQGFFQPVLQSGVVLAQNDPEISSNLPKSQGRQETQRCPRLSPGGRAGARTLPGSKMAVLEA